VADWAPPQPPSHGRGLSGPEACCVALGEDSLSKAQGSRAWHHGKGVYQPGCVAGVSASVCRSVSFGEPSRAPGTGSAHGPRRGRGGTLRLTSMTG
jgi:hypothetical protein